MGLLKAVNKQVKRTRDWIFSALLSLLDEKKYEDIKIANITEKAGVARQSFYRNYEGKDDIVAKFIEDMFALYSEQLTRRFDSEQFNSGEIYRLFFDILYDHRDYLLKLKNASLSHLLYNNFWQYSNGMIDAFLDENRVAADKEKRAFLQYQLGGIIALALDWICTDMQESPTELSEKLQHITLPFSHDPCFLPTLIQSVKERSQEHEKAGV